MAWSGGRRAVSVDTVRMANGSAGRSRGERRAAGGGGQPQKASRSGEALSDYGLSLWGCCHAATAANRVARWRQAVDETVTQEWPNRTKSSAWQAASNSGCGRSLSRCGRPRFPASTRAKEQKRDAGELGNEVAP
jgi:hypothetical protein